MITTIPQKAIDLILESEGIDQPWRWPGGGSGITLGYGCDIGADPTSLHYWTGILTSDELATLAQAQGITGRRAQEIQSRFRGINVTRAGALKMFMERNLPVEIARTLKAFPGLEFMPDVVIGAMVSLVFNRGTALDGNRRHEMLIISQILAEFRTFAPEQQNQVKAEYIRKIAVQFRKMKRLWQGQGLDGLLVRRDAEADLVLSAISRTTEIS